MLEIIEFQKDEQKYINDFLKLPRVLYTSKELMEDRNMVKDILEEKHVLNKYYKIYRFVAYKDKKIVGRFLITVYPNDDTSYFGFYECVKDNEVSKALFEKAVSFSKELNLKKIIGPVDCSFWIKYRLKINKFDLPPYTGEPYNKDYYLEQFKAGGFEICEHYTSQIYKTLDGNFKNDKFEEHYKEFIDKGYEIVTPKKEDISKVMDEVYYMLMDLYSDFPIFKSLTKEDFKIQFESLGKIINMQLNRMAYYKGKAVGFYISIPNYSNAVHNINLFKLLKILRIKHNPKEYVMLYMGVDREHRGLGKALSKSIADELNVLKKPSIGALSRDGKINQNYAEEVIDSRYEYVLLSKEL